MGNIISTGMILTDCKIEHFYFYEFQE